jgi:hypothetical protein
VRRSQDSDLSLFPIEALDTADFLKKVLEYDSRLQSKRRGELTAAQKGELDRYENQIVSLTGWLVSAYAGPSETTNCAGANFHDWHLEIFANPSDHAPFLGKAYDELSCTRICLRRQRIGNQIDTAMITTWTNFVGVLWTCHGIVPPRG